MSRRSFILLAAVGAMTSLVACAALLDIGPPPPEVGFELQNGIKITPAELKLVAACPGTATSDRITLDNRGDVPRNFTVTLPEGAPLVLLDGANSPQTTLIGTVAARRSVDVTLKPITTAAVDFKGGKIKVQTEDAADIEVSLDVLVKGVTLTLFPPVVDFGAVPQNTPATPQPIRLKNDGTVPVRILGFKPLTDAGAEFAIAAAGDLAAQQEVGTTASFLVGTPSPPLSADFQPITDVLTCTPLPTVTLKGTRVDQSVTVNPTVLDFGEADCNYSPGILTKVMKVTNYAPDPAVFKIAPLAATSRFSLSATGGTVDAAVGTVPGTMDVTVTLKAMNDQVAADLRDYSEDITVDVTSPKPQTTTVQAKVKSVGAIIDIAPRTRAFSSISFLGDNKDFTITNSGNKYVYLAHTLMGMDKNAFSVQLPFGATGTGVKPNSTSKLTVRFAPNQAGTYDNVTISSGRINSPPSLPISGQICNPPVPDLAVSGTRIDP